MCQRLEDLQKYTLYADRHHRHNLVSRTFHDLQSSDGSFGDALTTCTPAEDVVRLLDHEFQPNLRVIRGAHIDIFFTHSNVNVFCCVFNRSRMTGLAS